MLDTGYWILDARQILDDLIPICFPEVNDLIGDTRLKFFYE